MQGSNSPHSASMSEVTGEIKQIACGRRKPNMTRKEYNDHRFRVHGALSDAEEASPQYTVHLVFFGFFPSNYPLTEPPLANTSRRPSSTQRSVRAPAA
jgi:hypothetical protein